MSIIYGLCICKYCYILATSEENQTRLTDDLTDQMGGDEKTQIEVGLDVLVDGEFEPENPLSDDTIVYDNDEDFDRAYVKLFGGKFLKQILLNIL